MNLVNIRDRYHSFYPFFFPDPLVRCSTCSCWQSAMSAPVLISLLRCGRASFARQTFSAVRSAQETSTPSGQVKPLSAQVFLTITSWFTAVERTRSLWLHSAASPPGVTASVVNSVRCSPLDRLSGGRGFVGDGGCAACQRLGQVWQRRPTGDLGLVWDLGQPDRRTRVAALQCQIWETRSSGEFSTCVLTWMFQVFPDHAGLPLRSVCLGSAARLFWVSGSRTRTASGSPVSMITCCTSPCSTATEARTPPTTAAPSWRNSSGGIPLNLLQTKCP